MSTSRFIEIRPDNKPADGKISFKNGFPVLSFTISAQSGLLDPRSVRIVGDFAAYKDNLATPTPLTDGDGVTMNNRLGIYNVFDDFESARFINSCIMLLASIGNHTKSPILITGIARKKENDEWVLLPGGKHIIKSEKTGVYFLKKV